MTADAICFPSGDQTGKFIDFVFPASLSNPLPSGRIVQSS
jgi:hypothetical protein